MHTRGSQLSVGEAPDVCPSVAIDVLSIGPTTVAQVESTNTLELPYRVNEENNQHGTTDTTAVMHRRFNLIPRPETPHRLRSHCGA